MDNIKLGSGRKTKQDFEYYRQIKSHLNEIEGKRSESMIKVAKSAVDSFPHQCRYYKPCEEIVINSSHNYGHFKRVHPWTEDEQEFILTLFEESPNSKNIYMLSALYGRSEKELRNFFKAKNKRIPKWGRKEKEVADVHELINEQIQNIRTNNRIRLAKVEQDKQMDAHWDNTDDQLLNPFPINVEIIQAQNYLIPPDPIGSKDFYKNIVDALLEKHKYWVTETQRLKNRIQELDNQVSELKNKLTETMDDTALTEEEVAEYKEQVQEIYKEF